MEFVTTEHYARSERHTTFYLAAGADAGPLIVFVHGWPSLADQWRHQLACFASLGFRAVAPDKRGYGRSTVYARREDYAVEHGVRDMLELIDSLGHDKAIWVGHDIGSAVVWQLASHHPDRCHGVVSLAVPHQPRGFAPENVIELVDRSIYPEDRFPVGQWDYQLFYRENFERATAVFDADVANTVSALFRRGNPDAVGKPARTSQVRRYGGWFGDADAVPALPRDETILSQNDYDTFVAAFQRNGFFGPDAWYVNADRNVAYAETSLHGGRIDLPVLFLHARYDTICETVDSRLAEPMREYCPRLSEAVIDGGHWLSMEQPAIVNAALAQWLVTALPAVWPTRLH